jgi:hypothetical protein
MRSEPGLATKIERLHAAFDAARLPHAFGGALALAYYAEPRATHGIDVNVFVSPRELDTVRRAVESAAGEGVEMIPAQAEQDGQTLVSWGRTPLDIFFSYDPIHDAMRRGARSVPFADTTIPILSPEHLVICKAVFDRAQDWVDIDSVVTVTMTLDGASCLAWLERIVGREDRRFARLAGVLDPTVRGPA